MGWGGAHTASWYYTNGVGRRSVVRAIRGCELLGVGARVAKRCEGY